MPTVCVAIGPPGLLTVGLRYPLFGLVYCPDSLVLLVGLSRAVSRGNVCRRRGFSTPSWVYHRLPGSLLSERICLAVLVWSASGLPTPTGSHAGPARRIGGFGLVTGRITIAYQPPDLGLNLPCTTFTNHYRRGLGTTHRSECSRHQAPRHRVGRVAQGYRCIERWCTVENTQGESERWHTGLVGVTKKILKSSGRSACFFEPMVVKLVGQ